MKVYIVVDYIPYEGGINNRVFTTKEAADKYIENKKEEYFFNQWLVEEWEVEE